jgi:hypothetical protein
LHHKKRGRLNCDFREAIKKMPRIIDSSRYRSHLNRWIERFGSKRVLIILQEDISVSPEQVLDQVYSFSGIARLPAPAVAWERVNVASLPSVPALAWLATCASRALRDRRLHRPIELARRLGLTRIYSGAEELLPAIEPEIRKELVEEFEPDIAYVENLLRRSLADWRIQS